MRRATNVFGRAVREAGLAMNKLGQVVAGDESFRVPLAMHRNVMALHDKVNVLPSSTK